MGLLFMNKDVFLTTANAALRTLFAEPTSSRATPSFTGTQAPLTAIEKKQAAALMRVNHVGEVCAQALYTAQAAATKDPVLRLHFETASKEETDHLAWTKQRLVALNSRTSLLNPLWYAGAFAIGAIAGKISDRVSLGFVVETENQVANHLDSHLALLPTTDLASRAIVAQMKIDEIEHAEQANKAGAIDLPAPIKGLMRVAAKIMTTTAHYI